MANPIDQFRAAIEARGMTPPDTIDADGKLHRFSPTGKRTDDAGWYVLYLDGIAAGCFGDWRSGLTETWRIDIGRRLSPEEEAAHKAKLAAMRRERDAEDARRKQEAQERAATIWKAAEAAPVDHPYLTRKRIAASGARTYKGQLVIPMRADGKLHSLQFISTDGEKRFLTGGRVAGCYHSIGGNPRSAAALAICEGYATGASIHEATGLPVAVAFNAGNLLSVAQAMRQKFPDLPLIVCADDDYRTDGNPGLTKATEAARSVGGLLAVPDFGGDRPDGATDFNDASVLIGPEAVRQAVVGLIEAATPNENEALQNSGVAEVTGGTPSNGKACAVTPAEVSGVTGVTEAPASTIPEDNERPCFRVFDDWQEHGSRKIRPGVWFFGAKDGEPVQSWICSPLHVEAVTFDAADGNFGRLLRFRNTLGRWREWAMPMEMLRAGGDDLRGELLAMGVEIDPTARARNLLTTYLQDRPPKRRMRCALQVGWCDGSFVLPDTVIGPKASGIIFQSGERGHDEHTRAGTLADWQAGIAARAVGNPLLALALSAAFAGPLLARCGNEGGGVHFNGDSSTGKTTLIEAACSTWGGPGYRRSWRSTANGMEGAAALFNDCLLALDEISECDPREVGAIVYALGNGRGKQRAGRTGSARAVTRWRCFVVSSGERSIATAMAEGGQRAKAGQAVRLLDIPAARTFGAWDNLHDLPTGTAFSDAIKRTAATHYGHAGRAFLEKLTRDQRDFSALLEQFKGLPEFSADGGEGQEKRAAGRFALLALAGELATEYGLTHWPEGEAISAAGQCFAAWRSARGRGNDERRQILDRVSDFIDRHGDGRFSDMSEISDKHLRDRAGWWRDSMGEREYLFTAEAMREALKGFDFGRGLDALQEAGAMPAPSGDGKRARSYRIGGRVVKLYPVNAEKLGGDHGA